MIKITFDTSVLPADDLILAAQRFDCDFAVVTVTAREVEGTRFEVHLEPCAVVHETGVYGEARYGQAVYASHTSAEVLDKILRVISSGAFPQSRADLSDGQVHQFRDALILEAHIREGRDIFVTDDARAFVRHGKREELGASLGVRILKREEFLHDCSAGTLAAG